MPCRTWRWRGRRPICPSRKEGTWGWRNKRRPIIRRTDRSSFIYVSSSSQGCRTGGVSPRSSLRRSTPAQPYIAAIISFHTERAFTELQKNGAKNQFFSLWKTAFACWHFSFISSQKSLQNRGRYLYNGNAHRRRSEDSDGLMMDVIKNMQVDALLPLLLKRVWEAVMHVDGQTQRLARERHLLYALQLDITYEQHNQ